MKVQIKKKGQALVEFAIILPILLLILMGIIQFGLLINTYLTISNLSREGARAGIVGNSYEEIDTLIQSRAPNLDLSKIAIDISPNESSKISGETLTVYVTYDYKLIIPIISSLFNNDVILKAQTSMRIE